MRERLEQQQLVKLHQALYDYVTEVDEADLTDGTKATYRDHATMFVRWIVDDFIPGAGDRNGRKGSNDLDRLRDLIDRRM